MRIKVAKNKSQAYVATLINIEIKELFTDGEDRLVKGISTSSEDAVAKLRKQVRGWMKLWGITFIPQYAELKRDIELALSDGDSAIIAE